MFFKSVEQTSFKYAVVNRAARVMILPVIISLLIFSCANPVSPGGGPKDEEPPVVVETNPENYTTGFSDNEIEIEFNEFVQLDNPTGQIIISPPLQEIPGYKMRGKSLHMEFQEELWSNATYTIFFGNAIKDITENNPLGDFQYVFSTGVSLDSMEVFGQVIDAHTLTPRENIMVMMYRSLYDSVPMKERPYYVSKTDQHGHFRLSNMADTIYRIFALKDANSNYIYDLPNEEIAFIDTLLKPYQAFTMEIDSTLADSLPVDSLRRATMRNDKRFKILRLFDEIDSTQKLIKAVAETPDKVKIIYHFPTIKPEIEVLKPKGIKNWKTEEWNPSRDTLICWLQDIKVDSLVIAISDTATVLDTVELALRKPKEEEKPEEDEQEIKEKPSLNFNTNIDRGRLMLEKNVRFEASEPVITHDFSSILFVEGTDTLSQVLQISFTDSLKRNFLFEYNWKPDSSYRLMIPDSALISSYGHSHDTLDYRFNVPSPDNFGNVSITVESHDTTANYIVQIVKPGKDKESIVREQHNRMEPRFDFIYVKPGKYRVKLIIDRNNNGRWDSGQYLKGIQPEEVHYLEKEIEVRAKWDLEETLSLQQDVTKKKPE